MEGMLKNVFLTKPPALTMWRAIRRDYHNSNRLFAAEPHLSIQPIEFLQATALCTCILKAQVIST